MNPPIRNHPDHPCDGQITDDPGHHRTNAIFYEIRGRKKSRAVLTEGAVIFDDGRAGNAWNREQKCEIRRPPSGATNQNRGRDRRAGSREPREDREALEDADAETNIVPLIIMTHTVSTGDFLATLTEIDQLPCVRPASVYYPVGD